MHQMYLGVISGLRPWALRWHRYRLQPSITDVVPRNRKHLGRICRPSCEVRGDYEVLALVWLEYSRSFCLRDSLYSWVGAINPLA